MGLDEKEKDLIRLIIMVLSIILLIFAWKNNYFHNIFTALIDIFQYNDNCGCDIEMWRNLTDLKG